MTRTYTKTGDAGQTGLFGGGRVRKDHVRVDAYGEVDELNALLGVIRALGPEGELDAVLGKLQDELFSLGSMLATPMTEKAYGFIPKVTPTHVEAMEKLIDAADAELPALTSFILPGGSQVAAQLHLARTVCRRAERRAVSLVDAKEIEPIVVTWLNRLSDLLFTLARLANHRAGVKDVPWNPPKG